VPKLGPLEWILNTPSQHRVHHARNPLYVDKNYGGTLCVFDRLFGTFQEEIDDTPCVYGLIGPLNSFSAYDLHRPPLCAVILVGRILSDAMRYDAM
jgi:alkylglycerol monooxygenase